MIDFYNSFCIGIFTAHWVKHFIAFEQKILDKICWQFISWDNYYYLNTFFSVLTPLDADKIHFLINFTIYDLLCSKYNLFYQFIISYLELSGLFFGTKSVIFHFSTVINVNDRNMVNSGSKPISRTIFTSKLCTI